MEAASGMPRSIVEAQLRSHVLSEQEISPVDATPLGIALMLLQPPFIYIIIGLVVICCAGILLKVFWETLEPYVYGLLDFIAMIVRGVVAAIQGCWWTTKRCCYPLKETILGSIDSCDRCMHPYKAKKPYTDVPTFQF
mmetsp:Transcript_6363/g.14050  ORF Transcript_6363/g.14050 Transcript_6363/m.14050 type:complete len:138 (-) Transcript_6363:98-511(-)